MGIRFRKSIKLGGARINASKSGIGYSYGTKGYRVTKTAKGTTRTTTSIPGTGISHVEETNANSTINSKANNKSLADRLLPIAFILLAASVCFFLFAKFISGQPQDTVMEPNNPAVEATSQMPTETENWEEIRAQAEEDRQARQKGKDYLTNLGYEIIESSGFKFTVALPGFINQDLEAPPENWETVHNDFISAASGVSEEIGRAATIYLQDSNGNHYLTIVGDEETYNVYEIEPDPTPEPTSNSNYNKYNSSSAVWISEHGRRYHSKASCSEMENPQLTSYGYAIEQGYTACQKCH